MWSTGRRLLETCTWFPGDFASCAFSLSWFCFVSFHCKKPCSWEWLFAESCGPSSRISKPDGVLGDPDAAPIPSRLNYYNLILMILSGNMSLLNVFSLKMVLAIFCLLNFHVNFKIISIFTKFNLQKFLLGFIRSTYLCGRIYVSTILSFPNH